MNQEERSSDNINETYCRDDIKKVNIIIIQLKSNETGKKIFEINKTQKSRSKQKDAVKIFWKENCKFIDDCDKIPNIIQ